MQAGRGIAALMVVIFHLNSGIFGKSKYYPDIFWWVFSGGHAGVEFFFVLSGFIIAYIHLDQIGKPALLWPFLRKRFIRIYPTYWVVMCAVLPVYFIAPWFGNGDERSAPSLFASVTLLPTSYLSGVPVAY
jgi:peptidoglycan/LPS O-acetylase OafA/YrhL